MNWFIKLLDITALVIQFLGAWIMYKNSPENRIMGAMIGGNYDMDIPKRKNKSLKIGFLILSIGIGLTLISTIIKWFLPADA